MRTQLHHIVKAGLIALCAAVLPLGLPTAYGQDAPPAGGLKLDDPNAIGAVVAIRGDCTATDAAGQARNLAMKGYIFKKDTVKTGDRGRLQIVFLDNSTISLGRETTMTIEEYAFNPGKKEGAMVTQVKEGVFRVMGGAITKIAPEKFKTETPTATIGIRGSFYACRLTQLRLEVVFLGGKGITVQNQAGFVEISQPSVGTVVRSQDTAPEEPRRFASDELIQLMANFSARPEEAAPEVPPTGGDTLPPPPAGEEGGGTEGGRENEASPTSLAGSLLPSNTQIQDTVDLGAVADTIIDTVAPIVRITPLNSASSRPTITGIVSDAKATVIVTVDATPYAATNNGNGTWTLPGTVFTADLPDGTYALSATATDPAGNTGTAFLPAGLVVLGSIGPPPGTTTYSLSGGYLATSKQQTRSSDLIWFGSTSATSTSGSIAGSAVVQTTDTFPFAFTGATASPGGLYTNQLVEGSGTRTLIIDSVSYTVPFDYATDNLGEFAVFSSANQAVSGLGTFSDLGYAGLPALLLPAGGLAVYGGLSLVVYDDAAGMLASQAGNTFATVNFANRKVIGDMDVNIGSGQRLYYYGTLDSNRALSDVRVLGNALGVRRVGPAENFSLAGTVPNSSDGPATTGTIYGSAQQGLGLTATSLMIDASSAMSVGQLRLAGAMFKTESLNVVPTGSATWNGFAVGMSETLILGRSGGSILETTDANGLTLVVDRNAGLVSGSMALEPANLGGVSISGIQLGGNGASAYVHDGCLISEITAGTVNSGARTSYPVGSVNQAGSFLVSDTSGRSLGPWNSWGHWAMSYTASGETCQVTMPGSYWVAGELTPASYVRSLIATTGATATYNGGAVATAFSPVAAPAEMFGTSQTQIAFDTRMVNGTLTFPSVTMTTAGTLDSGGRGFAGSVTSVVQNSVPASPVASGMRGDFFGPAANGIGGTFHAELPDATRYTGAFAGGKQ